MEIKVEEIFEGVFDVTVGNVNMIVEVELGDSYDYEAGTERRFVYQSCRGDLKVTIDERPTRISAEAAENIKQAINSHLYAVAP